MSHSPEAYFNGALDEAIELLPTLRTLAPTIGKVARAMVAAWKMDRKILFAGNGGSAADAMHFAEELIVRYHRDRRALAAIALLDPTAVTCAGNDMGYDAIFSRQIEALGQSGDVFIGITTSGNSPNILRALEIAKARGITTIGFLGKDGGKAKALCDIALVVPHPRTARVQEAHKMIYHSMCDYIDAWALGET
ncbi:MAG: SIS domain-containing protein [Burkholderiales bacterium]|nr:SIS domain-containing protein [Phycisphaerae bacterium]